MKLTVALDHKLAIAASQLFSLQSRHSFRLLGAASVGSDSAAEAWQSEGLELRTPFVSESPKPQALSSSFNPQLQQDLVSQKPLPRVYANARVQSKS